MDNWSNAPLAGLIAQPTWQPIFRKVNNLAANGALTPQGGRACAIIEFVGVGGNQVARLRGYICNDAALPGAGLTLTVTPQPGGTLYVVDIPDANNIDLKAIAVALANGIAGFGTDPNLPPPPIVWG